MSDTATTTAYTPTASTVRDGRCSETSRPERIAIGDDTWVRNDVQADSEGRSERSLNEEQRAGRAVRVYRQRQVQAAQALSRVADPRHQPGYVNAGE